MKIFHNPRCSKSRCALEWLKDNNYEFEVIDYLKYPVDKNALKDVLNKLKFSPIELIRKNEIEYKDFILGKDLSDDELIALMVRYPKLIERPVIVLGENAVVARPLEKLIEMLQVQN